MAWCFMLELADQKRPHENTKRNAYWHRVVEKHGYTVTLLLSPESIAKRTATRMANKKLRELQNV